MSKNFLISLSLLASLAFCWGPGNYPEEVDTGEFCQYFEAEFDRKENEDAISFGQSAQLLWSAQQVKEAFDSGDQEKIQMDLIYDTLKKPGVIGFIICFLTWPVLCCFCCCPDSHPACEKCRKPKDQPYGTCELKWPTIVLIAAAGLMIAGVIVGIKSEPGRIGDEANNLMCKVLKFQDKTLNGFDSIYNESTAIFSGYRLLIEGLDYTLDTNFQTTFYSVVGSYSSVTSIPTKQGDFEDDLEAVHTGYSPITYSNAFYDTGRVSPIPVPSIIDELLGPTTEDGTVLGALQEELDSVFDEVNEFQVPLDKAWNVLTVDHTASSVDTDMSQASADLAYDVIRKLGFGYDKNLKQYKKYQPLIVDYSKYIGPILYTVIGVVSFGLLVALWILLCGTTCLRKLAYFICFIVTILSLICLIVGIGLGALERVLQHSCSYLITDFTAGLTLLNYRYSTKYADVARKYLSNCTEGQDGNIFSYMSETVPYNEMWESINAIQYYTFETEFVLYNATTVSDIMGSYQDNLDKIRTSEVLDVKDSSAIDYLQALADKDLPITTCNGQEALDSFIPSHANNKISCSINNQITPCSDLSDLVVCPDGCYQIYNQFLADTSYATNLQSRYGATCSYATYLPDLHTNWNLLRKTQVDNIESSIDNIFSTTTGDAYWDQVAAFDTTVTNAQASLTSYYSSFTHDEVYRGADCRMLQEPIQEISNAACNRFQKILHPLSIGFHLIGWGGIVFIVMSVCTGVRLYKHENNKKLQDVVPMEQPSEYKFVDRDTKRVSINQFSENSPQKSRRRP